MKMKEKIFIVIAVIIFAVLVFAQNGMGRGRPDAEMMLQNLADRLNLTEEQQEEIEPLLDEQIVLMNEFHSNRQQGERIDMRSFQIENEKIITQIKSFLSEEQQAEYDKMREEMRQNRKQDRKGRN